MYKNTFFLIAFFIITSISAFSQIGIGIDGGAHIPFQITQGGYGTIGVNFGASVVYKIKDRFGIGLSAGYYHIEDIHKMEIRSALLSTEYNFKERKLRPYIGLDLGLFNYKLRRRTTDYIIIGYPEFMYSSETYFGFVPSIGFRYLLTNRLSLNLALKFTHIFIPSEDFNSFNPTIGINYTFK